MATDISSPSVNGNYGASGGYSAPTAPSTTSTASGTSDIPKDEVGWYFVEQYYTTLSRSPEKLYLFYNKRSQFVLGQETDKVAVCVGQRAINERIKELDFQDCKVRVTNVDSQSSDSNIVIQVIGEISNKAAPHKKFTQTFVLAGQTNGYFVLNDIFRYIVEEEDEAEPEQVQSSEASAGHQEPAPTATKATEPETLTSSEDPEAVEADASKVDKQLEEKVLKEEPSDKAAPTSAPVNGMSKDGETEDVHAEEAPEEAVSAPEEATSSPAPEVAAEQTLAPEKPKAPTPSPVRSPVKQAAKPASPATATAPSAAPSKPSAPKTWANLAAAAHKVAIPATPAPQTGSAPTPSQPKATPASAAAPSTPAPNAATPADATSAPAREASPSSSQQDEWTSVGDNKKQQAKGQAGAGAQEGPQSRAYIKNVNENIDAKELKALLEKFGEVVYFDVSRQKNCAFVDFKTPEGYKAAVEANPHQLGSERIIVEERRLKPGSYPYVQRGGMRGGRGAPNQGPNRGSFQGGRGGFAPRGRGGAASRGRGAAQAA